MESLQNENNTPAVQPLTADQLALLQDAYKTMDLIVHDWTEPLRTDLMLAFTYGMEFDPMITGPDRYAYEELDWGYTEQPYRQLSCLNPLTGHWDNKQRYLVSMLKLLRSIALEDAVLDAALADAIELFENIDVDAYETMRDAFDAADTAQDALYGNMLGKLLEVHWYEDAKDQNATVAPCVRRMMAAFAAVRAMAAVRMQAKGAVADPEVQDLMDRYVKAVDQGADAALRRAMETEEVFRKEVLEQMLWR